jgi:hypothetical protein
MSRRELPGALRLAAPLQWLIRWSKSVRFSPSDTYAVRMGK